MAHRSMARTPVGSGNTNVRVSISAADSLFARNASRSRSCWSSASRPSFIVTVEGIHLRATAERQGRAERLHRRRHVFREGVLQI